MKKNLTRLAAVLVSALASTSAFAGYWQWTDVVTFTKNEDPGVANEWSTARLAKNVIVGGTYRLEIDGQSQGNVAVRKNSANGPDIVSGFEINGVTYTNNFELEAGDRFKFFIYQAKAATLVINSVKLQHGVWVEGTEPTPDPDPSVDPDPEDPDTPVVTPDPDDPDLPTTWAELATLTRGSVRLINLLPGTYRIKFTDAFEPGFSIRVVDPENPSAPAIFWRNVGRIDGEDDVIYSELLTIPAKGIASISVTGDFEEAIFECVEGEGGTWEDEPVVDPDPEDPNVDPEDPNVDPEDPNVDPEDPNVDPEDPNVDPEDPNDDPVVDPITPELGIDTPEGYETIYGWVGEYFADLELNPFSKVEDGVLTLNGNAMTEVALEANKAYVVAIAAHKVYGDLKVRLNGVYYGTHLGAAREEVYYTDPIPVAEAGTVPLWICADEGALISSIAFFESEEDVVVEPEDPNTPDEPVVDPTTSVEAPAGYSTAKVFNLEDVALSTSFDRYLDGSILVHHEVSIEVDVDGGMEYILGLKGQVYGDLTVTLGDATAEVDGDSELDSYYSGVLVPSESGKQKLKLTVDGDGSKIDELVLFAAGAVSSDFAPIATNIQSGRYDLKAGTYRLKFEGDCTLGYAVRIPGQLVPVLHVEDFTVDGVAYSKQFTVEEGTYMIYIDGDAKVTLEGATGAGIVVPELVTPEGFQVAYNVALEDFNISNFSKLENGVLTLNGNAFKTINVVAGKQYIVGVTYTEAYGDIVAKIGREESTIEGNYSGVITAATTGEVTLTINANDGAKIKSVVVYEALPVAAEYDNVAVVTPGRYNLTKGTYRFKFEGEGTVGYRVAAPGSVAAVVHVEDFAVDGVAYSEAFSVEEGEYLFFFDGNVKVTLQTEDGGSIVVEPALVAPEGFVEAQVVALEDIAISNFSKVEDGVLTLNGNGELRVNVEAGKQYIVGVAGTFYGNVEVALGNAKASVVDNYTAILVPGVTGETVLRLTANDGAVITDVVIYAANIPAVYNDIQTIESGKYIVKAGTYRFKFEGESAVGYAVRVPGQLAPVVYVESMDVEGVGYSAPFTLEDGEYGFYFDGNVKVTLQKEGDQGGVKPAPTMLIPEGWELTEEWANSALAAYNSFSLKYQNTEFAQNALQGSGVTAPVMIPVQAGKQYMVALDLRIPIASSEINNITLGGQNLAFEAVNGVVRTSTYFVAEEDGEVALQIKGNEIVIYAIAVYEQPKAVVPAEWNDIISVKEGKYDLEAGTYRFKFEGDTNIGYAVRVPGQLVPVLHVEDFDVDGVAYSEAFTVEAGTYSFFFDGDVKVTLQKDGENGGVVVTPAIAAPAGYDIAKIWEGDALAEFPYNSFSKYEDGILYANVEVGTQVNLEAGKEYLVAVKTTTYDETFTIKLGGEACEAVAEDGIFYSKVYTDLEGENTLAITSENGLRITAIALCEAPGIVDDWNNVITLSNNQILDLKPGTYRIKFEGDDYEECGAYVREDVAEGAHVWILDQLDKYTKAAYSKSFTIDARANYRIMTYGDVKATLQCEDEGGIWAPTPTEYVWLDQQSFGVNDYLIDQEITLAAGTYRFVAEADANGVQFTNGIEQGNLGSVTVVDGKAISEELTLTRETTFTLTVQAFGGNKNIERVWIQARAEVEVFELTDGVAYTNGERVDQAKVTYTRTFNNTDWQPLYVPFDFRAEDLAGKAKIAQISGVHTYDTGETLIEFLSMTSGIVNGNTPYVIKVAEAGELTISSDYTTVYPAESYEIECSTTLYNYSIIGTYEQKDIVGDYGMYQGNFVQVTDSNLYPYVKPYRFYMSVDEKQYTGKPLNAPAFIRVSVDGEASSIESITTGLMDGQLYDLMGRKVVENPAPGIYVRDGQKVIIK